MSTFLTNYTGNNRKTLFFGGDPVWAQAVKKNKKVLKTGSPQI